MAGTTTKEIFRGGIAKMLKEQIQVDVLLKANDNDGVISASKSQNRRRRFISASKPKEKKVISAHKFILSGRSEVFKKMLESDEIKTSTQLETIALSDMNHEELEAFIDFLYGDESVLSRKQMIHVRSLYVAANKYMIPHLRDLCRNELILTLNESNAVEILELAQIPFDKTLNDAAYNAINTNIGTVSRSDDFKQFVVNHPNYAVKIIKNLSW